MMKTSNKIALGIIFSLLTGIVAFAAYVLCVVKELSNHGLDFHDEDDDFAF